MGELVIPLPLVAAREVLTAPADAEFGSDLLETPPCPFTEAYYLRGKQSGLSLYEDYRWLPELTHPMVRAIVGHLGILAGDRVLDFGAARGYVVRALREQGHQAWGYDISPWAVANADEIVRGYVTNDWEALPRRFDWVLAKDVLEHIPDPDLHYTVQGLCAACDRALFVVVPLSPEEGAPYVVPEYEQDVTHVQRKSLEGWHDLLLDAAGGSFQVECRYKVQGVKQNWTHYDKANGFLVVRRKRRA